MRAAAHDRTAGSGGSKQPCGQAGFVLVQIVAVLGLVAALALATGLLRQQQRLGDAQRQGAEALRQVELALVRYVEANRRLPCPAAYGSGDAAPAGPSAACTSPAGGVPWRTLGLTQAQGLDGWGRYIAYRVFSGPTGVTRADGAAMRNCNLDATPTGSALADCAAGAPPTGAPDDFLLNKGLELRSRPGGPQLNAPAGRTGAAFLLVSYGRDGRGATVPGGGTVGAPPATAYEFPNASTVVAANGRLASGAAYVLAPPASDPDAPLDDTHFDDVVRRMTLQELAQAAGLGPRNHGTPGAGPDDVPGADVDFADLTLAQLPGTAAATQTEAPTIVQGMGAAPTTVEFGSAPGGTSRACLFVAAPLDRTGGRSLRAYLEFSLTADPTNQNGEGFVAGFVPAATPLSPVPCGDPGSSLGWAGGTLPAARFGVEIDTAYTSTAGFFEPLASSPAAQRRNHVAVLRQGVRHTGADGPACIAAGGGALGPPPAPAPAPHGCEAGPTSNWLEEGAGNFHQMRIEVAPTGTAGCAAGEARVRAWVFRASAPCVGCTDLSQPFAGTAERMVQHCAATPAALDNAYFGIGFGRTGGNVSRLIVRRIGLASAP